MRDTSGSLSWPPYSKYWQNKSLSNHEGIREICQRQVLLMMNLSRILLATFEETKRTTLYNESMVLHFLTKSK